MKRHRSAKLGVFSYKARGVTRWGVDYVDTTGRERRKANLGSELEAIAYRDERDRERVGQREPDPEITFDQVLEAYQAHRKEQGRGEENYTHLDSFWAETLKRRALASITSSEIAQLLAERRRKRGWSPTTRNLALAQLSGLMTFAYRHDPPWLERHPTARGRVAKLEQPPPRGRWLRPREIDRIISHARPWLQDLLRFAAATGMRLGEICDLRVQDLAREGRDVYVVAGVTKNGEPLRWPLKGWVRELVQRRARSGDGPRSFLFPGPGRIGKDGVRLEGMNARTAIKRELPRAVKAAGLEWGRTASGVTFHTFRHSMATNARRSGIPEHVVQRMGNWRDRRMLEVYAHTAEDELAKGASKMAEILAPRRRVSVEQVGRPRGGAKKAAR